MRQEHSDIILALYRAAGQNLPIQGFLDVLARAASADKAHLILQSEDGAIVTHGAHPPPLPPEALQRMRYLRAYSPDDMAGYPPFRALRTRVDGGCAWITVMREGGDLSASVSLLLGALAPHIAQAAAMIWAGEAARAHSAAMVELAARAGLSWVLLGPQGAVIAAHEAPAAYVQGARLRLPLPAQKRVLAALDGAKKTALQLPDMQALLVPFQGHGARAIVYFMTRKSPPNDQTHVLESLYAITPAEARFAAQLAMGHSIAQAGEALGLTAQTARHYSKQLYAKLGAAGLPDVIRTIENSVYRLVSD